MSEQHASSSSAQSEATPQSGTQSGSRGEDSTTKQATALRDAVAGRVKTLDGLRKALDNWLKAHSSDYIAMEKAVTTLAELRTLQVAPYGDEIAALCEALTAQARELRRGAQRRVMGEIKKQAAEAGAPFEVLGEHPPVLNMWPVTVELDLDKGCAHIQFARENVTQTVLDAKRILETRVATVEQIKKDSVAADVFFKRLNQAYRMTLIREGKRPGDRVDLVDLIAPLSTLFMDTKKLRKAAKIPSYPRHLLAYQLYRLSREQKLVQQGRRVELGTATGGSTRNKTNVLYVPMAPGQGQYYLSVRLADA